MSCYCLPVKPYKEQNFPSKYSWIGVIKEYKKPEPQKGEKKVNSYDIKEYNETTKKRSKMFKQLDTGYYNCFNSPVNGEDITREVSSMFRYFNSYYYRVKPISSRIISNDHYRDSKKYALYEFDIIKKCETPEELLLQLYKDNDLVEFMREVLDTGTFSNEGYRDTCIKWFKYCKENFENFNMYLSDIIFAEYKSVYKVDRRYSKNEKHIENLVIELIDAEYINLYDIYMTMRLMYLKL